jgi:hypothetical protein
MRRGLNCACVELLCVASDEEDGDDDDADDGKGRYPMLLVNNDVLLLAAEEDDDDALPLMVTTLDLRLTMTMKLKSIPKVDESCRTVAQSDAIRRRSSRSSVGVGYSVGVLAVSRE